MRAGKAKICGQVLRRISFKILNINKLSWCTLGSALFGGVIFWQGRLWASRGSQFRKFPPPEYTLSVGAAMEMGFHTVSH